MNDHRNPIRRRALRAALTASLLGLLAACGGGGGNTVYADQPTGRDAPSGGAGSGSATTHGQPARTDGAVELSREGSDYIARRRVGIRNDFGGASNGFIEAALQVRRSLTADFETANGEIDVAVEGSPGYDLVADTTSGTVRIDVAGTVAVGAQTATSAHRRSGDYDSRPVKAQIAASTTNGNVEIHQ